MKWKIFVQAWLMLCLGLYLHGQLMAKHRILVHPIHVSMTNVEWNEESKKFEIIIKLYRDDFELLLEQTTGQQIFFTQIKTLTEVQNAAINAYLNQNLNITLNNHTIEFDQMKNWHTNGESVWLEYQITYSRKIKRIAVKNKLMTQLFDDQTNLFIMSYNNTNIAHSFNSNNSFAQFNQ